MERNSRNLLRTKKRTKTKKELHHFQQMQISDDKSKKNLQLCRKREKTGLDELFVTCLNHYSGNKIGKPIQNYFDFFINTSLNHMSIRSRFVSQPSKKLKLNNEQSINSTDLSAITFGVFLSPKLCSKI